MKKIALVVSLLFIGGAVADSAPTSVGYVDSQIGALQNKISAVDTNTVLTTTNTAGEIGQKSIYDATGTYAEQTDALVTAEVANAAVQNAIDNEFICIDESPEGCLIYQVMGAVSRNLPSDYTLLQYLESTGEQYIDTGLQLTADTLDITVVSNVEFTDTTSDYSTQSRMFYVSSPHSGVQVYTNNGRLFNQTNDLYILLNTRYNVKTKTTATTRDLVLNGTERPSTYKRSITDNSILYLFGNEEWSGNNAGAKLKLYLFKVYKNDVLVRDFVPVIRNSDGKPGLYDFVSETFFTNSGSGEFIPGAYLTTGN